MVTTRRATNILAVGIALMLLSACGTAKVEVSGKAKSLASDAVSAALDTEVEIGVTTTAPGPDESPASPSTTDPVTGSATTTGPTSTTTPPPQNDHSDDAFCRAAAQVANVGLDAVGDFDFTATDSQQLLGQLKSTLRSVDGAITEMDRTAPTEIAADMHTLATELSSLVDSIEADRTFEDVMDSMMALHGATTTDAGKRVGSYLAAHCGFTFEGHATR